MILDIIVSIKLSDYHYRELSSTRVIESDEFGFNPTKVAYKYLSDNFIGTDFDSVDYDKISTLLNIITEENYDQVILGLNFLGFYVDVFNRLDLIEGSSSESISSAPVRVYLTNLKEDASIAISSDEVITSSVADCAVNLFTNKLSLKSDVAEIVGLNFELENYTALAKSGSGFMYDANKFINLITSGGRVLKVFLKVE